MHKRSVASGYDKGTLLLMDPKSSIAANIFGTVVALIVVGFLGRWLKGLGYTLPLWQYLAICLGILAIFLGLAHLMDRQDAAKERQKFDPSSLQWRRLSDQDD